MCMHVSAVCIDYPSSTSSDLVPFKNVRRILRVLLGISMLLNYWVSANEFFCWNDWVFAIMCSICGLHMKRFVFKVTSCLVEKE